MRDNERRLKRVLLPERMLVEMFQGPGQCVGLRLDHPRLPADARVIGIHHDYSRQALVAIVHSREFEIVAAGRELPVFDEDAWRFANVEYHHVVGDRIVKRKRIEAGTWSAPMPVYMPELSPEAKDKLTKALERARNVMRIPQQPEPMTAAEMAQPSQLQPEQEAARDWFRRIMSQPAE